MPKIFISYRRIDSQAMASLIYRSLAQTYKNQNVFLDTTTITSGKWWEQIQDALNLADVVIVVIGPKWETEIQRRLNLPDDYVREEVKIAINKNKLIMLAFVDGVKGIDQSKLPQDIRSLPNYQAFEILHNPFFDASIDRLINNIPRNSKKSAFLPYTRMIFIIALIISFMISIATVYSIINPFVDVPTPTLTDAPTNIPTATEMQAPTLSPTLTYTPMITSETIAMVLVPSGCFMMGSDPNLDPDAQPDEQPAHNVCITQDFWIDQYEVTNEAFQQFVDRDGYSTQEYWSDEGWQWLQANRVSEPKECGVSAFGTKNLPRVGISWYEAQAYAQWRGGRLPSEAEWEYVARGMDANIYPWGNTDSDGMANIDKNNTGTQLNAMPVNSFTKGVSWVNVYHLAGNVSEWVMDAYDETYYKQLIQDDPLNNPTNVESARVLRGGSWSDNAVRVRSVFRFQAAPNKRECTYGFRVVLPK